VFHRECNEGVGQVQDTARDTKSLNGIDPNRTKINRTNKTRERKITISNSVWPVHYAAKGLSKES